MPSSPLRFRRFLTLQLLAAGAALAQAAPSTVTGVVVDTVGRPIRDAAVQLRTTPGAGTAPSGANSATMRDARTDSAGAFRIPGIAPGPVLLTVAHAGHRAIEAEADVAAGVTIALRITLQPVDSAELAAIAAANAAPTVDDTSGAATGSSAPLRGRVLDGDGRPLADAEVTLLGSDESVRTDADGAYTLRSRPAGTPILRVRRVGFTAAFRQLAPDATTVEPITLGAAAQQLATVKVRANWSNQALADFTRRKQFWGGEHVTADEIARRNPLRVTDVLIGRGLVSVRRTAIGDSYVTGRTGCLMSVSVNGVLYGQLRGITVDQLVNPADVAAIEAYPSRAQVPTELNHLLDARDESGCGLVAVWTK
ncbi:MAG: carboxypeptidase regulatory-like domain-containing protein [Gemmatimonadaceae bacterium]|nr:carboxypeptidase regulatory-like domain-containing protein [Gemmatimonadaceae bacterium]